MDLGPVWCYNCTDETTTRVHDASLALAPPAAAAAATSSVLSAEVSLPPSSSSVHQNRFDIIRVATESVVGVSVDVVPLEAAATAVSEAAAATAVVDTLSSPSESGGSVVISSSSSSSGTTRAVEMGGLVVTATARSSQHFLGWHPESSISCAECSAELGWIMVEHASASERNGDDDDAGEGARAKQRMSFAALQLLRVKQREWSLRDIQTQHWSHRQVAKTKGAAAACELCHGQGEELRGRLQVLTMQCTLYSTLLDRHKEQNTVQTQLLSGQKERMKTLEDKLETMQQILDAQKQKLDMQMRHIQLQDLLIRDHREQALNQQKQIDVEQKLLADQNSTIRSQLDQLRILRSHLHEQQLSSLLASHLAAARVPSGRPLPDVPVDEENDDAVHEEAGE